MAGGKPLTAKCAKCGSCTQVCPVYLETGRESNCPRGKLHLFNHGVDYSADYFNALLSKCIQCGACDAICSRDLEPSQIIRAMRSTQPIGQTPHGYSSFVARQILNHPPLLTMAELPIALLQKLPAASGLRQNIRGIPPHKNSTIAPAKKTATTPLAYYPGCLASHFQTDINEASKFLASLWGYKLTVPKKASCCGLASSSCGKEQEARNQALKNMAAYRAVDGPILTSCGSCYAQLTDYPRLFNPGSHHYNQAVEFKNRIQEFSTFFVKEAPLTSSAPPHPVYYHDPCHLRFATQPVMDAPRQLIRNLTNQAVVNTESPLGCCGQGGLFAQVQPAISAQIFNRLKQNLTPSPGSIVVTTCSSCLMAWQQQTIDKNIKSQHLSVFLAKRCENC